MATKVKPTRLQITGTPQAWDVPQYVDADTFQWWQWWGWGDVSVSTDTGNELTTWAKLWLWLESDFSSITTPDSNTMYIQYVTDWGWGWQPWVNTLAYYQFNWDLTDGSGNNYNLTNSWTTFTTLTSGKKVLSVEQASATYTWWPNLVWKDVTVSFWMADTASRSGYSDRPYITLDNSIVTSTHSWQSQWNKIYVWVQWQNNYDNAPVYNDVNVWHHVVITFENSIKQLKEYVDNSLKTTTTLTTWITDSTTAIRIWGTGYMWQVHFMMWDCILEDKVRTAQEISDYYDLTKWDYWIS